MKKGCLSPVPSQGENSTRSRRGALLPVYAGSPLQKEKRYARCNPVACLDSIAHGRLCYCASRIYMLARVVLVALSLPSVADTPLRNA